MEDFYVAGVIVSFILSILFTSIRRGWLLSVFIATLTSWFGVMIFFKNKVHEIRFRKYK